MALTYGPNLGLLVGGAAGDEHFAAITAQFRGFDLLIQCAVLDRDLTAPPGAPADGDAYIVASGATGAWSGKGTQLARWSSVAAAWEFFVPKSGWRAHVVDEQITLTFVAGAWQQREAPLLAMPNNQAGTAYTFGLSDGRNGTVTRFTSASDVVATVPTNASVAFPVGTTIPVRRVGTGALLLSPASGAVTINVPSGYQARAARQGSTLLLHKVGGDEWDLTGDLASV